MQTLSSGKPEMQLVASLPELKLLARCCGQLVGMAAELPSKKYLNLGCHQDDGCAAEAEAQKPHVEVTICIVDESGNLLFLRKPTVHPLNTIQFAQKKARHAAFYRSPFYGRARKP